MVSLLGERASRVTRVVCDRRRLRYAVWVRAHRLDFAPVPLDKLGFSEDVAVHHAPSGGVYLADVLKQLDIPPGSRVLDLGCGKGSALCTLARFPFVEVAGLDMSADMALTAMENARRLHLSQVDVTVGNAAEYTDYDRYTHLYLFNPFPAAVMTAVMGNLAESLQRAPRRFTVIYFFPVCDAVLTDSGLFDEQRDIEVGATHPYRIYTHH